MKTITYKTSPDSKRFEADVLKETKAYWFLRTSKGHKNCVVRKTTQNKYELMVDPYGELKMGHEIKGGLRDFKER